MIVERSRIALLVLTGGACMSLGACKREAREFRQSPPSTAAPSTEVSALQPGPVQIREATQGPDDDNAYAMSEGKDLFSKMNCVGCHWHGGGGMGPPLMDAQWIYGSDPSQVYATIAEGRPNGMPSFKGKLSNDQIWELVAYVRSMSGIGRRDVRGGRDDHMQARSSEQNTQNRQAQDPSKSMTGAP